MRMFHYFATCVAVVVPALLVSAWLGISGRIELHFKVALVAAIATVGAHCLLILFMILTGRIMREAIRSRDLSREFLGELNEFFAKKSAYPIAIFAALAIVLAAVLAQAQHAFGLHPSTHMLAGILALAFNLYAFPVELKVLRQNRELEDRAAAELDAIDLQLAARGELPVDAPPEPGAIARGGLVVAVSAWMPYLYWGLVEWRGDFSRVSLHPWVEASAAGVVVWQVARTIARQDARERVPDGAPDGAPDGSPSD